MPRHVEFQVIWDSEQALTRGRQSDTEGTDLIVRNIVVCAHSLYLHWTQHPANIINDFYVSCSSLDTKSASSSIMAAEVSHLFQLEQFGGLHQVLQLECTFRHVV